MDQYLKKSLGNIPSKFYHDLYTPKMIEKWIYCHWRSFLPLDGFWVNLLCQECHIIVHFYKILQNFDKFGRNLQMYLTFMILVFWKFWKLSLFTSVWESAIQAWRILCQIDALVSPHLLPEKWRKFSVTLWKWISIPWEAMCTTVHTARGRGGRGWNKCSRVMHCGGGAAAAARPRCGAIYFVILS